MATIVLSAAGMAAGSALGGSVFGLSTGVIGRAIGATVGRVIDQRVLGRGSDVVETGRVDRFRISGASEGTPIGTAYGRARVPGQIIWATQFKEIVSETESSGGKGAPRGPTVRSYSYSISLAVALCEGEISGVLRMWADGLQIEPNSMNWRFYPGSDTQMPDPKIEAVEGAGNVPAYRGTAYVVIEDLDLTPFGNRVPQFSFEIVRPAPMASGHEPDVSEAVRAVALIPGTGEYSLATTPVHYQSGFAEGRTANVNAGSGKTDLLTSLDGLAAELPNCEATVLVVSWFGDDLRVGSCTVKPKVEFVDDEGADMPWFVSGTDRAASEEIIQVEGRPVYGGTPTDRAVIEGIQALKAAGQAVTFYPFILMDQLPMNGRPDPYSEAPDQPDLPWRGRITTAKAPGQPGSTDGTAAAEAEVATFVGTASVTDFADHPEGVTYTGPQEWSYRRFILHYAHLCAKAGGVDAFCVGSEMRGFTRIRGANNRFPAVDALIALVQDVRSILGPDCKISYASDWSEYFGYHPQDGSGDVFFHLDPFWSHPDIDFIAIDNYMPLSDWRDVPGEADADWGSIYNLDYLRANVAGGEGYDWFYPSEAARTAQERVPITDGAYSEPWVFRYKDLRNWWSNLHHNRINGVRETLPTAWQPGSKPFWFTEYGCAAVDKATNQPNKFIDPKSSESRLPYHSDGRRDDLIQAQYVRAVTSFWADPANNPISALYGAEMVDMTRAHVWAWDARPYPYFPGNTALWSDGANYLRGHWLNGRASARSLDGLVAEIVEAAGVAHYDVSELYGLVKGFTPTDAATARERLQPLMLAYGFDALERDGMLVFRTRSTRGAFAIDPDRVAVSSEQASDITFTRTPEGEAAGRLRLTFAEAESDYAVRTEEAVFPDGRATSVSQSELPLVLTRQEARSIVERWLSETRIARDVAQFSLPPSEMSLRAGDVVALSGAAGPAEYRIDRVEQGDFQILEAVRVEPDVYEPSQVVGPVVALPPVLAPIPVEPVFLDLPLLRGDEVPHAPHIAATSRPWPGAVAVYAAVEDAGYQLNTTLPSRAIIGLTETALLEAKPGLLDRGPALRVKLVYGDLSSVDRGALLNGANLAAIGSGSAADWEVFQFQEAELVGERTYELRLRLRGQFGTEAEMLASRPAGSLFVLLTPAVTQIDLPQSARGLERYYRIGPAQRPFDDPSFQLRVEAFDGKGLRPFAPVHVRADDTATEDTAFRWLRRTRLDGDTWQSTEVPLGEAEERYHVQIIRNGAVVREAEVTTPAFTYTQVAKMQDGVVSPYEFAVAQISDRFGSGPYKRMMIDE